MSVAATSTEGTLGRPPARQHKRPAPPLVGVTIVTGKCDIRPSIHQGESLTIKVAVRRRRMRALPGE